MKSWGACAGPGGLALLLLLAATAGQADDACSSGGIRAIADVVVSDGTGFRAETVYQGRHAAAVVHTREDGQTTIAVDGSFGWHRQNGQASLEGNFHRLFALGHQFHAFLLYPDELLDRPGEGPAPVGSERPITRRGDYPFGGRVYWLGDNAERPDALRFDFPGRGPITAELHDWQAIQGRRIPMRIEIHDGELRFDYRYSSVELEAGAVRWYHEQVPAPDLDPVLIHRLHRELLAAHCRGDAATMAALSADVVLIAAGGNVSETNPEAMRRHFEKVFERLDYSGYEDLQVPRVAVSGELGWAVVNVRATGTVRGANDTFDDQWAWVMLARKVDGEWVHAGNAANRQLP